MPPTKNQKFLISNDDVCQYFYIPHENCNFKADKRTKPLLFEVVEVSDGLCICLNFNIN